MGRYHYAEQCHTESETINGHRWTVAFYGSWVHVLDGVGPLIQGDLFPVIFSVPAYDIRRMIKTKTTATIYTNNNDGKNLAYRPKI